MYQILIVPSLIPSTHLNRNMGNARKDPKTKSEGVKQVLEEFMISLAELVLATVLATVRGQSISS